MIKINTKERTINLCDLTIGNNFLDGGVYMFTINEFPLYIGETNIFLKRLTEHLYELKKDLNYFGLEKLSDIDSIKYYILKEGYPYKPCSIEHEKRKFDENAIERRNLQNEYIENWHPLCQNPLLDDEEYLAKIKSRKKDGLICEKSRSEIIKTCIANPKAKYVEIIAEIKKAVE